MPWRTVVTGMNSVTCQISISLDGFAAGANKTLENPLGEGGMQLHEWAFASAGWRRAHGLDGGEEGPDSEVAEETIAGIGAYIMGRKMFGGGPGPWEQSWTGWWGDDPPFHAPVFVLTHHAREPLQMLGGTSFMFVTDGFEAALDQARAVAGDQDVAIAGGAATVQQFLAAGLLDELYLHIAPVILGAGERLLENVGNPRFEPVKVVGSPAVTHIKYRVLR
jgi:dihydrofolate reductase